MAGNALTLGLGNEITMPMVGGFDFFDAKCASANSGVSEGGDSKGGRGPCHTIPDATTLVLLGSAMLGVAVIGRKKVFKR